MHHMRRLFRLYAQGIVFAKVMEAGREIEQERDEFV